MAKMSSVTLQRDVTEGSGKETSNKNSFFAATIKEEIDVQ
jgi:hypothetical protein